MQKFKKILILCGALIQNVQLLYLFKRKRKTLIVRNVILIYALNVIVKVIKEKVVILYLKTKLNNGKIHKKFKNAKNAVLSYKRFLAVIICLALSAVINGAGFVEQTIVKDILIL
jgi:hypothetical protein